MTTELVSIWRRIILGSDKSWVLFENGTCVIFLDNDSDLKSEAIEIMKEFGPVHAGSSAGDFSTIDLTDAPGWAVTGHHPDVLNYVSPSDVSEDPSDLEVGMLGRSNRDADAAALRIIHVEDKR